MKITEVRIEESVLPKKDMEANCPALGRRRKEV